MAATTLICTVGTSLLTYVPQLLGREEADLKRSGLQDEVLRSLLGRDPDDRLCGAEINSILLIERRVAPAGRSVYFLHSETDQGGWTAEVLKRYYEAKRWYAETRLIKGLRDDKPGQFRSEGLRRLAREMAGIVRKHGPQLTIINATGGYKAQVAIAVLLGQAMGTTVYYKHERFNDIIDFPPMPVSFDFQLWLRHSHLFFALDRGDLVAYEDYRPAWEEALEPLIQRVSIDGPYYLELTPVGQIFHERLKTDLPGVASLRPPAYPRPRPRVRLKDHDWRGQRARLEAWLNRLQTEKDYVGAITDAGFERTGRAGCRVMSDPVTGREFVRLRVPVADMWADFRVEIAPAAPHQIRWAAADIELWREQNPL
ncbi:MAG: putative CRISPR-associated protein [Bacillota bacterium]|nr:putative CRISPR-associated protein [Bacillota bacterium]